MKTKIIFKTLAFAILMPTMLLSTACSNDDIAVNNNENTVKKGYTLPVTVNVTRQSDVTRALYNDSDKKLEFSSGDQLFVRGTDNSAGGAGIFSGTLTWQSEGTFCGTIITQNAYSGTVDALFTAGSVGTLLLPAGYGTYGYWQIGDDGTYDANLYINYSKAFATSKAAAVEQFSNEMGSYSSGTGFALHPWNAILNFTITGLVANTNVNVSLTNGGTTINGRVTTNSEGTATFAMAVENNTELKELTLRVGGNAITLSSTSKELEAGHIYNIIRSAAAAVPKDAADATAEDVGKVIGANGKIYYDAAAAVAASTTAVAVICYVGAAGSADASSATYKGLALALSDASSGATCAWCSSSGLCLDTQYTNVDNAKNDIAGIANTNTLVSDGHTHAAASAARGYNSGTHPAGTSEWFLPSLGQWAMMATAVGSPANLLTKAGLSADYWSSTECDNSNAYEYASDYPNYYFMYGKTYYDFCKVRACLAF